MVLLALRVGDIGGFCVQYGWHKHHSGRKHCMEWKPYQHFMEYMDLLPVLAWFIFLN